MSNTLGTNYTYYKVKHLTDDAKECFVGSAIDIKRRIYEHKHATCQVIDVRRSVDLTAHLVEEF